MEGLGDCAIVQYWSVEGQGMSWGSGSLEAGNQDQIIFDQLRRIQEITLARAELNYLRHVASGGSLKVERDGRSDLTRLPMVKFFESSLSDLGLPAELFYGRVVTVYGE